MLAAAQKQQWCTSRPLFAIQLAGFPAESNALLRLHQRPPATKMECSISHILVHMYLHCIWYAFSQKACCIPGNMFGNWLCLSPTAAVFNLHTTNPESSLGLLFDINFDSRELATKWRTTGGKFWYYSKRDQEKRSSIVLKFYSDFCFLRFG